MSIREFRRHWDAFTGPRRRRRFQSQPARQVELCEPRQLLSATGAENHGSEFCDPVTIVSGAETQDSTPLFEWEHVEGATEYEIFVGQRGTTQPLYRTTGIAETSFEMPVALPFGDLTIWVRAHGPDGQTNWGSGQHLQIGVRTQIIGDGNDLTWNAVPDATYYDFWVQRIDTDGTLTGEPLKPRTSDTELSLGPALSGSWRAWVQPVRLEGDVIHRGLWSSAVDLDLNTTGGASGIDIAAFGFELNAHEYFIQQGEVRTGDHELNNLELAIADGAIPDAGEYLLRISGAANQLGPYGENAQLRYLDVDSYLDFLERTDLFGPSYAFQFELTGVRGRSTFQTLIPIIDLTAADVAVLGAGPISVRVRIRLAFSSSAWSQWTPPFQFTNSSSAPELRRQITNTGHFMSWSRHASSSSFDENEIQWVGGFATEGIPQLQTGSLHYEVQLLKGGVPVETIVSRDPHHEFMGLAEAGFSARVRSVVDEKVSAWSNEIVLTTAPQAVDFQLSNFSPVDRTPTITWNHIAGTKSYQLTILNASTQSPVYQQTFNGHPLQQSSHAASDPARQGLHQLTTRLADGAYVIRMDAEYQNGDASLADTPLEFRIGGRPEFELPTRNGVGTKGAATWSVVPGATSYRVWMNQVDQNGDVIVTRAVDQIVTETRFEFPTELAAGTYRTWVQAMLREADGQLHRSSWAPAVSITLSDAPVTYDVSDWEAVEYHVQQAAFDSAYIVGDLPAYTLQIGNHKAVQYGHPENLRVEAVVFSLLVREVELTNLDTGQQLTLTGGQEYFGSIPDLSLNIYAQKVATLGTGQISVRARLSSTIGSHLTGPIASRWSSWSDNFSYVLGSESPGTLTTVDGLPPFSRPVLTWPQATTIRRFDESEMVTSGAIASGSTATPTITETAPRYEVWITDLEVNERVVYETDLTESEFTVPHVGRFRAWVRTIVDGDQTSPWSAPIDFQAFAVQDE